MYSYNINADRPKLLLAIIYFLITKIKNMYILLTCYYRNSIAGRQLVTPDIRV